MRLTAVRLLAVAAVVLTAASSAFGAGTPASARLLSPPNSLSAGASVTLKARVAAAKKKTPAGTVKVALSADSKLNAGDLVLASVRFPALKPHRTKTLTIKASVPSTAAAGNAYLLACVGKRCSAASVTIVRPGGSGDPVTTGNGQFPSSVPQNIAGVTPNPRSVTPVADPSKAASGLVTADAGGTITATAGSVTYKLDVPKGAVLSDVQVTMTPLSSIGGLPASGGFAGGVQFSPDGLELLGTATLTVTGAPGSSLAAFGYRGTGSNLGLVPLIQKDGGLVIPITHFSGVGIGFATSADIQGQVAHAPAGTADQLRQQVAVDLRNASSQLQADATAYWNQVIKPKLEAALHDDSLASAAISEALSFARTMELVGITNFSAEALDYYLRVLVNMYNHAYTRCVTNHDPGEVRNLLASLRNLQLLGAGDRVDQTKADRCLTFHLDYQVNVQNGNIANKPSTAGILDMSSMGAPMTFQLIGAALQADLPLTVNSWTFFDYLCNKTGGTATPTEPAHATLTFNLNPQVGANGVVTFGTPTFKLVFSPGKLTLLNACGLDGFAHTFYPLEAFRVFTDLPRDASGAILIDKSEWTYQGGEVYATVDDQRTLYPDKPYFWTTHMRFTLHHDPAAAR